MDGERLHEHELRDGMAYGDLISPRPLHEHTHHSGKLHHGDGEESLYEHELRDGMAYGDTISGTPLHDHHHEHSVEQNHLHSSDQQDHHAESDEE